MEPTKETPETEIETWERCMQIMHPDNSMEDFSSFEFAKMYHSARLSQSLPKEEEIERMALNEGHYFSAELSAYSDGFKKCLELLTKGR